MSLFRFHSEQMLCVSTAFNISLKELNRGKLNLSYVYSQYFGVVIKKECSFRNFPYLL